MSITARDCHGHPTRVIGVVGGLGPLAGFDLCRKIAEETRAENDQHHLDVLALSSPRQVPDRTQFLMGHASVNPGVAIADQSARLAKMGAGLIGIPCNTAHAPAIMSLVRSRVADLDVELVDMVTSTMQLVRELDIGARRIGLLATEGTRASGTYATAVQASGGSLVLPSHAAQTELIDAAIYHPTYGVKSAGPTSQARAWLLQALQDLVNAGAECVLLACSEIPLAVPDRCFDGVPLVDTSRALARALIRQADPGRLRQPWSVGGALLS